MWSNSLIYCPARVFNWNMHETFSDAKSFRKSAFKRKRHKNKWYFPCCVFNVIKILNKKAKKLRWLYKKSVKYNILTFIYKNKLQHILEHIYGICRKYYNISKLQKSIIKLYGTGLLFPSKIYNNSNSNTNY